MRLIDYINPDCVSIGHPSGDKESTLQFMVDLVSRNGMVKDRAQLLAALKRREEVVSTGIGNRIAIPHADLPEIQSPSLALGIFPAGVDFDSLDEEPVHVVFLLLGTPKTPGLHMKILARIARLSKDVEFASGLINAGQTKNVLAKLEELEANH